MTKGEFVKLLENVPDDAELLVWDLSTECSYTPEIQITSLERLGHKMCCITSSKFAD